MTASMTKCLMRGLWEIPFFSFSFGGRGERVGGEGGYFVGSVLSVYICMCVILL